MSNHTTYGDPNAISTNAKPQRDFEKERGLQAQKITTLSKEARVKAATVEEIFSDRLNAERNSQQRSRAFRELRAKSQLLENYVRSDMERPNDAQSKENDLRIIDERSKEMVREREAHFLGRIENERFASLEHVIQQDQERQAQAELHSQSPSHEQAQQSPSHGTDGASPSVDHDFEQEL